MQTSFVISQQDSALSSMKTSASAVVKKTVATNVLDDGAYLIHLQNKITNQWFEIRDLVVAETMPQLIGIVLYFDHSMSAPLLT